MPKTSGFSLLELLVVVGILIMIAGMIMPNFNFFQRQSALDATGQEIIGALRLAQSKTLASESNISFGVYFAVDSYTIFKGTSYSPSSPNNDAKMINPSLKISNINLGGGSVVVFDRLTGATANYGTIKIEQISDSAKNKTIFIDSSGLISSTASSPSDLDRIKDSRHIELAYSQNAQNASNLKLSFPSAGVVRDIDFQAYLNADKTQFYWDGTVNVAGAEQKIKIHTHSLTLSDALFCVHRDRRYNSQGLSISLDGQNIINYASDGTTTKGTSIWAGEPARQ